MSKEIFTIDPHIGSNPAKENAGRFKKNPHQPVEPLSGSKKVKNRNHSRANHGEGS
ncbi:small acid-soluble spore protein P [Paenibacillus thermotolerans]|uniref:small acid-soluble spore protein P n=1 Tax=Paenibacillus thermotolerans TaxID=3027807 RepID=UPI00236815A9|nr:MULTISPECIES: small acid-soluble spore protein P [unclassified Paenibacillus]